jgi:2-dehydropantoate 2-reductase
MMQHEHELTPASVETSSLKVLVVGTGAVGGFYGAHLAKAGARVSVVCRSDHATVSRHGIVLVDAKQEETHFVPEQVFGSVQECTTPPDVLLVTCKSLPDLDIASLIHPAVGPETRIVLLQNGIATESPVVRTFPEHEVIRGLAFVCLNRVAPGRIVHLGYGRLSLGRYPSGTSAHVEALATLFRTSGIPTSVSPMIVRAAWQKLVWNAPFNPLSVLGGATTREILDHPASAQLAAEIMAEVLAIAKADGHPLPVTLIEQNMRYTREMAPYQTSMLLDYRAGRPMEIDAILGHALRIAEHHRVPAPRMSTLYTLLQWISALHQPAGSLS